jgi:tetratricopeptide (TPR) repeat protein
MTILLLCILACALLAPLFPRVGTAAQGDGKNTPAGSPAGRAKERPAPLPYAETNPETLRRNLAEAEARIAGGDDDIDAYRRAGLAAQQLAVQRQPGYVEKAVERLESVIERDPEDGVMRAYLGSAYAIKARDGGNPLRKLTDIRKAIALLNKAVEQAPTTFMVRMLRGSVFFDLPALFRDDRAARDDFRFAAERAETSSSVPAAVRAEILYKLGVLAQRNGDDKNYQERCFAGAAQAAPKSRWARMAEAALQK